MKKIYVCPLMKQEEVVCCMMMAASGVNSSIGIGFGGVDNNGEMEPSTKEFLWDSDDFDK